MLHHGTALTITLITCGEDTEAECRDALGDVQYNVIRDVQPQSKAANRAMSECPGQYLVTVDSDMVLYPGWMDRIERSLHIHHTDPNWYQILFWLYDTLTNSPILALKLQRPHISLPLRDVRVPDRDHYPRMRRHRPHLQIYGPHGDPIGNHIVAGPERCYFKYKDAAIAASLYGGGKSECDEIYRVLRSRHCETNHNDYLYCIAGLIDGLRSDDYQSKRHSDEMLIDICGVIEEYERC